MSKIKLGNSTKIHMSLRLADPIWQCAPSHILNSTWAALYTSLVISMGSHVQEFDHEED